MSNASPYSDNNGRPQLCDSLCLFVDILGYSDRIRSAFANNSWEDEFQNYHNTVLHYIREIFLPRPFELENPQDRQYEVKTFTDNIVLGNKLHSSHGEGELGNVIIHAIAYQSALALKGYFVRGGIARGLLYMDELSAYGPALLDAYELENKTAVFPRIVLSKRVIEMAESHLDFYSEAEDSPHNQLILKDQYGTGFLNYLYNYAVDDTEQYELQINYIGCHKELIIKKLEDKRLPSGVRGKYEWLANYHNYYFRRFNEDPSFNKDLLIPYNLIEHQFLPFVQADTMS